MTLQTLEERLKEKGHQLTECQKATIIGKFGYDAYFDSPITSSASQIRESLADSDSFILHENGRIDHCFDQNEKNSLAFMYWYDGREYTIFLAYF